MNSPINFDVKLPDRPPASLPPDLWGEFNTLYIAIRAVAEQVGGLNMLETSEFSDPEPSGFATLSQASLIYRYLTQDTLLVNYSFAGASNSTSLTFKLPAISVLSIFAGTGQVMDNSVILATPGSLLVAEGSDLVTVYSDFGNTGWTAAGNKSVSGSFIYRRI